MGRQYLHVSRIEQGQSRISNWTHTSPLVGMTILVGDKMFLMFITYFLIRDVSRRADQCVRPLQEWAPPKSVKVKVWKWKCESESMHPPSFLQPGSDPLVSGCPGFGSWRSSEHSFKSQCPSFTISSYVPYHFFGLYSSAAYLVSSFPSVVLQGFPPYSPLRFGNLATLLDICNLTWLDNG